MFACRKFLLGIFVILICFSVSACNVHGGKTIAKKNVPADNSAATTGVKTNENVDTGTSLQSDGNTWLQWKSDALKLSFSYPSGSRITVTPDGASLIDIYISGNVSVGIRVIEAQSKNEAEFITEMKRRFTVGYPDSSNDFLEYVSNYDKVSGYPAAYIEYKWNVMKTDMRTMEKSVLNGKHEITMYCVYKLSDDNLYLDTARKIIGSLDILSGEIDLSSLNSDQGVESEETSNTDVKETDSSADTLKSFTKYPIALSGSDCNETGVQKIIGTEFGQDVIIADWEFLKSAYGEMLPAVLSDLGLENETAAWVSANGTEFFSGNNHFFIQRFDNGKPGEFLAHDQIGSIYLGSWNGINMRVLAYKNPE